MLSGDKSNNTGIWWNQIPNIMTLCLSLPSWLTTQMSEQHRVNNSRGGFKYDSEMLESPVEVMTFFAQNSMHHLQGDIVWLIWEHTRERQGKNILQGRAHTEATTSCELALNHKNSSQASGNLRGKGFCKCLDMVNIISL